MITRERNSMRRNAGTTRSRRLFSSMRASQSRPYAGPQAASSDFPPGAILSWEEVNRIHRIQSGVYHRGAVLISLLTDFGRINPCYPDRQGEIPGTIYYTGEGRHGDQHLTPGNRALLASRGSGRAVPLFNKLAVGRWQFMGMWQISGGEQRFDERASRMLWVFRLRRDESKLIQGSLGSDTAP